MYRRTVSATGAPRRFLRSRGDLNSYLGRWEQVDPSGYPDGANRYTSHGGSPLYYVDPGGLELKYMLPGGRPTSRPTSKEDVNKQLAYKQAMLDEMERERRELGSRLDCIYAEAVRGELQKSPIKGIGVELGSRERTIGPITFGGSVGYNWDVSKGHGVSASGSVGVGSPSTGKNKLPLEPGSSSGSLQGGYKVEWSENEGFRHGLDDVGWSAKNPGGGSIGAGFDPTNPSIQTYKGGPFSITVDSDNFLGKLLKYWGSDLENFKLYYPPLRQPPQPSEDIGECDSPVPSGGMLPGEGDDYFFSPYDFRKPSPIQFDVWGHYNGSPGVPDAHGSDWAIWGGIRFGL